MATAMPRDLRTGVPCGTSGGTSRALTNYVGTMKPGVIGKPHGQIQGQMRSTYHAPWPKDVSAAGPKTKLEFRSDDPQISTRVRSKWMYFSFEMMIHRTLRTTSFHGCGYPTHMLGRTARACVTSHKNTARTMDPLPCSQTATLSFPMRMKRTRMRHEVPPAREIG